MNLFESINKGFDKKYGKATDEVKKSEAKKKITEAPIYGMEPQYDKRASFYNKATVDDNGNGEKVLYSYNTPVAKIKDGKVTLLPKWDFSATTLRHVREFLLQNGFKAGSKAEIKKLYDAEEVSESAKDRSKYLSKGKIVKRSVNECDGTCKKSFARDEKLDEKSGRKFSEIKLSKKRPIKEYKDMGQDLAEYQKWVDYDMKKYHKISDKTMGEIKKAGLSVVKDQYGDYEVIAKAPVRESRVDKNKSLCKTHSKKLHEDENIDALAEKVMSYLEKNFYKIATDRIATTVKVMLDDGDIYAVKDLLSIDSSDEYVAYEVDELFFIAIDKVQGLTEEDKRELEDRYYDEKVYDAPGFDNLCKKYSALLSSYVMKLESEGKLDGKNESILKKPIKEGKGTTLVRKDSKNRANYRTLAIKESFVKNGATKSKIILEKKNKKLESLKKKSH